MSETKPLNYCRACGQDFASIRYFDQHRIGEHDYTFAEGLAMTPPREDGRRCRDPEELRELGLELNARGYWHDPRRTADARKRLETGGANAQNATEGR